MSDKWNPPNAPNVKQDFNEAAKQQAQKEIPVASKNGIATKAELDKRTGLQTALKEKLARENAPVLKPKGVIAKDTAQEKFQNTRKEYEENEATRQKIKTRLEQK